MPKGRCVAGTSNQFDVCHPFAGRWADDPSGKAHNFHFTSEIHFQFTFDAAGSYWMGVTGDDDVWVFIDQRLAVQCMRR